LRELPLQNQSFDLRAGLGEVSDECGSEAFSFFPTTGNEVAWWRKTGTGAMDSAAWQDLEAERILSQLAVLSALTNLFSGGFSGSAARIEIEEKRLRSLRRIRLWRRQDGLGEGELMQLDTGDELRFPLPCSMGEASAPNAAPPREAYKTTTWRWLFEAEFLDRIFSREFTEPNYWPRASDALGYKSEYSDGRLRVRAVRGGVANDFEIRTTAENFEGFDLLPVSVYDALAILPDRNSGGRSAGLLLGLRAAGGGGAKAEEELTVSPDFYLKHRGIK
jgi:hypothetical protein